MTRLNRTLAAAFCLAGLPAAAEEVGQIGVDWVGNDIIIEAIADPKVEGVTCHIAYFERGLIDRLSKGNWFEDPSNASIACRQTGPITVGDGSRIGANSVVVRSVPPGSVVVGVPGRVVGGRAQSVMDLEHGRLPDPFSEAVRLILEEQSRLSERVAKLEESCGLAAAVDDLAERIAEIEEAFTNGEGFTG